MRKRTSPRPRLLTASLAFTALIWAAPQAMADEPPLASPVMNVDPAIQPVAAASLTKGGQIAVNKAEDWLNGVTTLEAQFVQITSSGATAKGRFYLKRPGNLRFEYTDPFTDFITTSGPLLVHWDSELEQENSTLLSQTPAAILLEETVDLDSQAQVQQVQVLDDEVHISMIEPQDKEDPTGASMTLVFDGDFRILKRWRVEDPAGNVTEVYLHNIVLGRTIPDSRFVFRRPAGAADPFSRNDR